MGKHHRKPFAQKNLWQAIERLQLIHADLCGLITPDSNGGKKYLFTLIDDYSRKLWTYFLVAKSEAFEVFQKFKVFIEKESGTEIAGLRTDRGGEFLSTKFKEFCDKVGIKRQLTTTFTPQQNGVAERRNRTIMNMVRCMLKESQVPSKMWPKAVAWATHILNRCPTSINPEKTPQELWSGSPPSLDHLNFFGSLCYAHVAD